jgi:hypothetical protein
MKDSLKLIVWILSSLTAALAGFFLIIVVLIPFTLECFNYMEDRMESMFTEEIVDVPPEREYRDRGSSIVVSFGRERAEAMTIEIMESDGSVGTIKEIFKKHTHEIIDNCY